MIDVLVFLLWFAMIFVFGICLIYLIENWESAKKEIHAWGFMILFLLSAIYVGKCLLDYKKCEDYNIVSVETRPILKTSFEGRVINYTFGRVGDIYQLGEVYDNPEDYVYEIVTKEFIPCNWIITPYDYFYDERVVRKGEE